MQKRKKKQTKPQISRWRTLRSTLGPQAGICTFFGKPLCLEWSVFGCNSSVTVKPADPWKGCHEQKAYLGTADSLSYPNQYPKERHIIHGWEKSTKPQMAYNEPRSWCSQGSYGAVKHEKRGRNCRHCKEGYVAVCIKYDVHLCFTYKKKAAFFSFTHRETHTRMSSIK